MFNPYKRLLYLQFGFQSYLSGEILIRRGCLSYIKQGCPLLFYFKEFQMNRCKKLFVGIDISLKKFDACAIDIDSNYLLKAKKSFSNNVQGLKKLCNSIHTIANENAFTTIIIGFEATGNYGFHLPFYLNENKLLKQFELKIFQINPKLIKNFRKSFSDLPKTDLHDSYIIAERLKIGKLYPFMKYDPHYFSLRFLTRRRFQIVENIVNEKSRFISLLLVKAPGFVQNKVLSNITGATSAALMTEYASLDEIVQTPIKELTDFVILHSKNKLKNPAVIAEKIKYVARESYRPHKILHDNLNLALLSSFRHIQFLKKELKQIDKEIAFQILTFPNEYKILTSIKGIGPVFAAGIISEIVDITLFNEQKKLAKYAGLTWRINESGLFKAEETSLTKSGNRYLRYYLVEAAQSVVFYNDDFRSYYLKKKNEVNKHQHKRAVVLCARKFIRVIFSLLKKNQLYSSPKENGGKLKKTA